MFWALSFFHSLLGFTLGSTGESGRGFIQDIKQAEPHNILNAMIGGVIFNASNILLVAAMAIAGMAVAFPVGVGIALALGVIINYIFAPQGNANLLFGGVALIVVAIIIDAVAYKKHSHSLKKVSGKGITPLNFCRYSDGSFLPFCCQFNGNKL